MDGCVPIRLILLPQIRLCCQLSRKSCVVWKGVLELTSMDVRLHDITCELILDPTKRNGYTLETNLRRDPSLAYLIGFDNKRGDPIKMFASRWFPELHRPIHSRATQGMVVYYVEGAFAALLLDNTITVTTIDATAPGWALRTSNDVVHGN